MAESYDQFEDRLMRIERQRSRNGGSYATAVDRDGKIVLKSRRRRSVLPQRFIVALVIGFMGFKALLMAGLGFGIYQDRVVGLQNGSLVEQAGAFVMQPDPVSRYLAIQLRPYLK